GRAMLPGRSGRGAAPEQGTRAGRSPGRTLAPSFAYARVRQPDHQCAALPATGSAWLSGQRDRTGWLGTLDEKRADHRAIQEPAAPQGGRALERDSGTHRAAGFARSVLRAGAINGEHAKGRPG